MLRVSHFTKGLCDPDHVHFEGHSCRHLASTCRGPNVVVHWSCTKWNRPLQRYWGVAISKLVTSSRDLGHAYLIGKFLSRRQEVVIGGFLGMGFRKNFSGRRRHHVIAPAVLSLSRKHVDGWVTIISVVCSRNGE